MTSPTTSTEPDPTRWWGLPPAAVIGGLVLVAALIPLLFLGPGSDLDASVVLHSGHDIVHHLIYHASRPPGAPVHEALVGVLDRIGGLPLANAGSLFMAAVCAVCLYKLCDEGGIRHPLLTTAILVANPWFLIAATSIADFTWALGFLLAAALAIRRDHAVWAGLLAALAVGSRMPTVLLVAAVLLAEALDGPAGRRRALIAGGVGAGVSALLFLPAFRAAGWSLSFARNDFRTYSLFVQAGRFLAKDLYLIGPLALVVFVIAIPAVGPTQGPFSRNWLVRFSVTGLVLSQALFFRFPWKMGHLLPTLVCLAILLGVAVGERPQLLVALVAISMLYSVGKVQLVRPDRPDQATSARYEFSLDWGPLVTDTRCRSKYRRQALSPNRATREEVWHCAAPFGSG